jgi:hypothetical protein
MGGAAVYREKVKTAFPTVLAAKGESLPVPWQIRLWGGAGAGA